jgi:hypothetical protein
MNRTSIARLAAVLSLAAAAACDNTPTATPAAPDTRITRPAFTLPVAQITVTDSGGTPLVGWAAVTGATSYTVRLITYNTQNGAYVNRFFQTLTSTTGTSYLDTGNSYTGVYQCTDGYEGPDGIERGHWYEYEVVSVFPTGTSSARHYAPITTEYC